MKKLLALLVCACMGASLLAGCGGQAQEAAAPAEAEMPAANTAPAEEEAAPETAENTKEDGKTYKFGFTEMSAGSFFDACYQGLSEVIEANGDEVIHVEGKADSSYQLGVIEDFIAQGCDLVFYNPSDAAASAADRAQGFIDTVTAQGFEVVAQMDAGAKPEKGLTVMEDLLQAHSDLTAVFCINDECAQGAYSAITSAGDDVEIYSVNAGPEAKAAMKKDGMEGIWKCSAAQSPIGIGKQSAEVAYKILNGEEYEAEVKIASFAVTPENIEEYGQADWQ